MNLRRRFQPSAIWVVGLSPLLPQILGSLFNIWYNVARVRPLLTPTQQTVLTTTILIYNLLVYPAAIAYCMDGSVW